LRAQVEVSDSKDLFHGDSKAIEQHQRDGISRGVYRGTAEIRQVYGAPVGPNDWETALALEKEWREQLPESDPRRGA
jgi:hypothetical protein